MFSSRGHEPGPSAAVRAFMLFAIRSRRLGDTLQRAVDVVATELSVPTCALVECVSPGHAVVVGTSGRSAPPIGRQVSADPSVWSSLVLRRPIAAEGRSAVSVRVIVGGQTWGRLLVADDEVREFGPEAEEVLRMVAAVLSAALERDRVHPPAALVTPSTEPGTEGPERAAEPTARDTRSGFGGAPAASVTEVALLDRDGVIVWVNAVWQAFCTANDGDPDQCGVGLSYLEVCEQAGDPFSLDVAAAIRAAVQGQLPAPMRIVIPCHGPDLDRWFDVLVSSRLGDRGTCLGATVTLSPIPA